MKRKIYHNIIVSIITFFVFCFVFVLGTIYRYFSVYAIDNIDIFTQNFFVTLIYGIIITIAVSILFSTILSERIYSSILKPINSIEISNPNENKKITSILSLLLLQKESMHKIVRFRNN